MRKRICALVLALLLTVLPALATGQSAPNDPVVQALFINVGKADSALLLLGEKRYLVDTGSKESAAAMLDALAHFGVDRLEGVFITHTDKDHVGGLGALLKSGIQVEKLYAPAYFIQKNIQKHPVYQWVTETKVPFAWLNAGDVLPVADGIEFRVLGPLQRDTEDENNNSLVLHLVTAQGDMLLAADMEEPAETMLLQAGAVPKAAVLKVGHHGDDDASSSGFIYTVRPQIAVVSTDRDVAAGTPKPSVMRRLWDVGAEVLLTQKATCGVLVTLQGGQATGQLLDYPTP